VEAGRRRRYRRDERGRLLRGLCNQADGIFDGRGCVEENRSHVGCGDSDLIGHGGLNTRLRNPSPRFAGNFGLIAPLYWT
jgi:hypothetical protein